MKQVTDLSGVCSNSSSSGCAHGVGGISCGHGVIRKTKAVLSVGTCSCGVRSSYCSVEDGDVLLRRSRSRSSRMLWLLCELHWPLLRRLAILGRRL